MPAIPEPYFVAHKVAAYAASGSQPCRVEQDGSSARLQTADSRFRGEYPMIPNTAPLKNSIANSCFFARNDAVCNAVPDGRTSFYSLPLSLYFQTADSPPSAKPPALSQLQGTYVWGIGSDHKSPIKTRVVAEFHLLVHGPSPATKGWFG